MGFSALNQPVLSPCVGVCTLDDDQRCIGCLRTADEIAGWASFTERERERIMEALEYRTHESGSG